MTANTQATELELRDRAGCELVAETLRAGSETRLRVGGSSMLPAIWPGDVLVVNPSNEKSLAIGQVVLFLDRDRLFAHRVVSRGGNQLITRGDTVPGCDPPVSALQVLGVVAGIIHDDGSVMTVASVPPIRYRMVAFAARHSSLICRIAVKWHTVSKRFLNRRGWIQASTS